MYLIKLNNHYPILTARDIAVSYLPGLFLFGGGLSGDDTQKNNLTFSIFILKLFQRFKEKDGQVKKRCIKSFL